ncbi:MAG: bacillithiol biosynthesis cysteine-adding enzyme BshC [Flavobacteriales bacterium]|nr:bacillithiol biosynthesis cysteine-adding enzyme BshC [Flavobacteriales bacterium]
MRRMKIPHKNTNSFSKLVLDYLNKDEKLNSFVNHFPSIENFEKQINEKQNHPVNRSVLVEVLKEQNANFSLSEKTKNNIESLLNENTFSITTGHQLCLFTGPLYFIYKIISTLNLSEQLQEKYPNNNFIPVFWMATEDHDFKEINHINLFGKKIVWDSKQSGGVGKMSLRGVESVLTELKSILGNSENADKLISLFEKTYLKHNNLADATRYLVNELFGKNGLVILDGDDKRFKKQFIPIIKKDILVQGFEKTITECSNDLAVNYKTQAFVRSINFFRLSDGSRELIKGGTDEKEIAEKPEKFSPNVLMRPLYQEIILPNIAYIGGGAEVAYWMQLKTAFKQEEIPFPILVLRNSAILLNEKQMLKLNKLGIEVEDLFLEETELHKQYILSEASSKFSLEKEKKELEKLFSKLLNKTTDKSLQSTIKAEQQKQLKSFQKMEQKLLKFEKKKHESALQQISKLKSNLFPNNSLQERFDNFIPYYLKDGENFIEMLKDNFDPLDTNFVVLSH